MTRLPQILLAATLLVLVAGIGLAVAQPGSLGEDDDSEEVATPAIDETTSTTADDGDETTDTSTTSSTTTTDAITTETTTATTEGGTSPTTIGSSQADTTPTTTTAVTVDQTDQENDAAGPGSGLGATGAPVPSDTADGLSATGGESLLLAGMALGLVGLFARRLR